jgi:hypothetical protein
MFRIVLPALLLVAGSAALSADNGYRAKQEAKDQAELTKALAGLTPGKPTSCIEQRRITDTQRIGDTILYKYSRREVYRADTNGGCFGLRRGDAIISRTPSNQLCSGDILTTVDLVSHINSGSCTIHEFVPYRR